MKLSATEAAETPGLRAQFRWGGRFAAPTDVPWHTHGETELVAVTAGQCRIDVGPHQLEGGRGALFVLPAGVAQYQATQGMTRTTFVGFSAPREIFDESARVLALDEAEPALQWLEQLCDGHLARPALSPAAGDRLLELLLRRIEEIDAARGVRGRLHPSVQAAIAHMESALAEPLTLAAIARQAGTSESHLGALFVAAVGTSPMLHLQRLRMEQACRLLDNPYLRIHEIAAACGYADANYFVRLFKQCCGEPPGRWRSQRLMTPTRF